MLDLRLPIGYFFLLNSIVLVVFGLVSPSTVSIGESQINLNVSWGSLMGLFGLVMVLFAMKSKMSKAKTSD